MINLKYVVTGTGRCGTMFLANLLTSLGLPCWHEAIFTTEGLEKAKKIINGDEEPKTSLISENCILNESKKIVADSSYMAAPFLEKLDPNVKVIHLIRNPIKVVKSFTGDLFNYFDENKPSYQEGYEHKYKFEKFIYHHLPELSQDMSQLERTFLYYIRWNKLIEKSNRVNYRHRIEDEDIGLKFFLNKQKKESHKKIENSISQGFKNIKLSNIDSEIKKELFDMMFEYGYGLRLSI